MGKYAEFRMDIGTSFNSQQIGIKIEDKFFDELNNDQECLVMCIDCTGHGVPGAMVSVVCNNGLNRSVREYGLTDPGKILDKTRY